MNIVIAGAGDIGSYLVLKLLSEDHEITLIDKDQDSLNKVINKYDVASVLGDCALPSNLVEAKVKEADLYIGVTDSEDVNILSSIFAKKLGAKKVISRIKSREFRDEKGMLIDLEDLGIDEKISPDLLAAREIERILATHGAIDMFEFDKGLYSLIGVSIRTGDFFDGRRVSDIQDSVSEDDFKLVAILRQGKAIMPSKDLKYHAEDHAYLIAKKDGIEKIYSLSASESKKVKDVMILGGSKVGSYLLEDISNKYNIRLIDRDRANCERLAESFQDVLVIHGDSRESGFLEEQNIKHMDALIAVTGEPEMNIIACLIAKRLGVSKTIALVKDTDYSDVTYNIGVDTLVNKKTIAASFISKHIRKGGIMSFISIPSSDIEIIEFKMTKDSKIANKKIKDLKKIQKSNAIIAGVVRGEKAIGASQDLELMHGDRVIVAVDSRSKKALDELLI